MTLDEIVRWFETLTPESVSAIDRYYARDATFKDPFNDVNGIDPIRRVFAHMFVQVDEPRFTVTDWWQNERGAALVWDFTFREKRGGTARLVRGASHLRFARDGRIAYHRDYWDVAEELYEKVPVLGSVLRAIKRRLKA